MTPNSRGLPDPVTEAYKKDIDQTLLRENLELSVASATSRRSPNWKLCAKSRAEPAGTDVSVPHDPRTI